MTNRNSVFGVDHAFLYGVALDFGGDVAGLAPSLRVLGDVAGHHYLRFRAARQRSQGIVEPDAVLPAHGDDQSLAFERCRALPIVLQKITGQGIDPIHGACSLSQCSPAALLSFKLVWVGVSGNFCQRCVPGRLRTDGA